MSRLLAYLLLGLILFVGYQWWSKQQAAPPPAPITAGAAKPSSKPAPSAVAPPSQLPPPDLGQMRMADPDPLPAGFAQAALLNEIRQVLEQGNTAEAQVRLLAIPKEALMDPAAKKYVAVLWNNLGVLQAGKGSGAAGIAAFKTAVSLDPGDPRAHINLTHAMWESKDPGLNKEFLEKTIRLAPNEPLPHLALADMLYDKDDLAGASTHYDQAAQHASLTHDPKYQALLQQLTTKMKREAKAEEKYISRESSHFTVKFDGNEDHAVWNRVAEILEEAYREIGQQLGHFPSKPILVVLHTRESFQNASVGAAWSDGLYGLGRISIPTQGALTDQAWLARVLRHEFVHALLDDRMKGRPIPRWLDEGLAMHLARQPLLAPMRGNWIKLTDLEGNWSEFAEEKANVAYFEGGSATRYLIDRFGMEKVREVLGQLANGQTMAAAVQDRLFITYEQFQQRWLDELNEKIKAGKL